MFVFEVKVFGFLMSFFVIILRNLQNKRKIFYVKYEF